MKNILAGKYEVIKCLGKGSLGNTYQCQYIEPRSKLIVVKVLDSVLSNDKQFVEKLLAESIATKLASHHYITSPGDFLRCGDLILLSREYIDGDSLADILSLGKPLTFNWIVEIIIQILDGLDAIHQAAITHGAIKPDNIFLTTRGVKVSDYGRSRFHPNLKITQSGNVIEGVNLFPSEISYIPPEYFERMTTTVMGDIYGVGIMAYELITGCDPFAGKTIIERIKKTSPVRPDYLRPDCPHDLAAIISKAIAQEPRSRYISAMEMKSDLLGCLNHSF